MCIRDRPTVEKGKTYDLVIQKIGDSLILSKDGFVYKEGKASEIFTGDAMYVGVFTSRLAKATFKDTTLTVTDANSDVVVKDFTMPSKQEYVQGNTYNDIDLAGFSANVTLGGVEKTITAKDCRIEVPDFSEITDSGKIVLDYFGTKIEIPVKVIKEVVADIKVDYNPIKTDYLLDEIIDLTGLEGNVVYNSGVTKKLQDLIAAGDADTTVSYNFSKAGKTQVTIAHTHGDVTKEYKFDVNVSDAKVTKIELAGPNRTTFYKDVVYDPYPENSQLENVIATAQREDIYKTKKRSYDEIIYSSIDLCDLFKVVYKLRVEYGVSYEDAQKLMTFGIDNRHYKPSDLLLPSEKQAIKYQKNHKETSEKLKNVTFPKI